MSLFTLLSILSWLVTVIVFGVLARPKIDPLDKLGWLLLVFCSIGSSFLTWMAYV